MLLVNGTSTTKRLELATSRRDGVLGTVHEHAAIVHARRMSLMVRASQGELRHPLSEVFQQVHWLDACASQGSADARLARCIEFLEHQPRDGVVAGAYLTASAVVVVDDSSVLVWRVGPTAVFYAGADNTVTHVGQDWRVASLLRKGIAAPRAMGAAGSVLDETSSLFAVGSPDGYQLNEIAFRGGTCIVMDRGALPFRPENVRVASELFAAEAGWQHGMAGHALLFGSPIQSLAEAGGWTAHEAALGAA